ncbi:hypothetical protein HYZ97_02985 [Candidatus Pacearchaeota archaeon]|nr:hypothetical protein [Candidatus Pacearchaeota archaeon]
MERDYKIGIFLLLLLIVLLGISFYVNAQDSFSSLADPLSGEGFGTLCSDEENCREFCFTNRGQCDSYCKANPANELCSRLFRGVG